MDVLINGARWIHIVLGFVGLAAWWVPILTKKGGQRHKTFGMVFALSAYVVAGTAMLTPPLHIGRALASGASLTDDPETFGFLLFLFYLGTVTLALTRHAVQTIRTRRDPDSIRTPGHVVIGVIPALGSLCVVIWAIAFWSDISIVMLALSPIGFFVAHDVLTYVYRRSPEARAWFYAHMGAMLGAGIAFHTAFLVFGSRIVISLDVFGPFNWVPWVLPGIVGTVGGRFWETKYPRKFGDLSAAGNEAGAQA